MEKDTLILVTGASGFIGAKLVKALLEQGYRVRGTVRSISNMEKYKYLTDLSQDRLELVEGDLMKEDGWENAVDGCDTVMHVASPLPASFPKDENEIIAPAVNGVKYVLNACVKKKIRKVVLTSSVVAIYPGNRPDKLIYTEEDFAVENNIDYYNKSKLLAEKEAWKIYEQNNKCFQLSVICPALVIGPAINTSTCYASGILPMMLLKGRMYSCPRFKIGIVHVDDVVKAHISAMEKNSTNGKRYIISNKPVWIKELAAILSEKYTPRGYSLPKSEMWYFTFYVASLFNRTLWSVKEMWGKDIELINTKSIQELGIDYISVKDAAYDNSEWLLEHGMVKRSSKDQEQ